MNSQTMMAAMSIVDVSRTVKEGDIFDINEAIGITKKYPESRMIIQKDNGVSTLYFYNDDNSCSCKIPEIIQDKEGVIDLALFLEQVMNLIIIDQLKKSF